MNRALIMTPFLFVAATFFAGCGDDSEESRIWDKAIHWV